MGTEYKHGHRLYRLLTAAALQVFILASCPLQLHQPEEPVTIEWDDDDSGRVRFYTSDPANAGFTFMSWEAAYFEVLQTYEVAVQLLSGGPNTALGMLFCLQDPDSYYAVLINTKGHYSIETSSGGSTIVSPWKASEHLATGLGSTNVVRVDFEPFARKFTVSFNGSSVTTITNAVITGGYAGYVVQIPEDHNLRRYPIDARFSPTGASPTDGVWLGDYVIRESEDLERIAGYRVVTGSLAISNLQAENLNGLESIERVGQNLSISQSDRLVDVQGLGGLKHVGRDLSISENDALRSLAGLSRIETIGGSLRIADNAALESIDGPSSLRKIGRDIIISGGKGGLAHVRGFSGLTEFNGDLAIECHALTEVSGFEGLNALNILGIHGASLVSFTACANLQAARFVVINGTSLEVFSLPALSRIETALSIIDNPLLTNLDLPSLESAKDVKIKGNDALPAFTFGSLREVYRAYVSDNRSLTVVSGSALEIVGPLEIQHNSHLTTCAFDNLLEAESVLIEYNDTLLSISMPGLESVRDDLSLLGSRFATLLLGSLRTVQGNLVISGADLKDLRGLSALQAVHGGLRIESCYRLTGLEGAGNLKEVAGNLHIWANPSLATIGLQSLITVGHDLAIDKNESLARLDGLEALTFVGGGLSLSRCPVESVAALGALRSAAGISLRELPLLTTLRGLEGVSFANGLELNRCGALTDLSALSELTDIGSLIIWDCHGLSDLTALSGLRSVYRLSLHSNNGLTSLDGLDALSAVADDIAIEHNPVLADLTALDGLPGSAFGGNLRIYHNVSLPTSAALALRDRFRADGWIGEDFIYTNGAD